MSTQRCGGPNNNEQMMEISTEDGMERPFFTVIEASGAGNVVRVINTSINTSSSVEFPLDVSVESYEKKKDREKVGG